MPHQNPCPLIVALDVPDAAQAMKIVDQLSASIDIFKVGLQLFTKEGPAIVDRIIKQGKRVFVDLKLHDIPNTVVSALENMVRPGVEFATLHGLGGNEMLTSAAKTVEQIRAGNPNVTTRLLCVTVLTSLDNEDLDDVGIDHSAAGEVLQLARLASACGINGVVASPEEISLLRQQLGSAATIVTPGVRMSSDEVGDQKRIATPEQAIKDGADFLVMGRSLIGQPKPAEAVKRVLESISVSR